jgi:HK97 family phage prohead protease
MTKKLLTVEEFRASARDGTRPDGTVLRFATETPEALDNRTMRFVFSDSSVDRSGDTIAADGWDISSFVKNPVALWAHDSSAPPIGRASNVGPSKGKLVGDIEFMPPEISQFADSIYLMVKGGYINAVSVGFIPLEYTFSADKDRPYGIDFKKQELLEISVCPVPCNPNALGEARAKGIDTSPLREWAEKLLDTGDQIMVPRNLLEEIFRAAKTPRTVRQKYLAKSDESDWKVGAARDLPTDGADGWDGPAAAKRMLDDAGFDGDSPDAEKAARGFLIHDSANPLLRSSYKLPFADIVDGELKAIKGGAHAAASRLMQTAAPAAVLEDAKSALDGYEEKFGEAKAASTDNMPTGSCGRAMDQECGMKDMAECAVHLPQPEKTAAAPTEKSGRSVSGANAAHVKQAIDHLQKVLDSNATDEPDGDENQGNGLEIPVPEEDPRAKRIREAKALKASLKA